MLLPLRHATLLLPLRYDISALTCLFAAAMPLMPPYASRALPLRALRVLYMLRLIFDAMPC